MYYTTRIRGFWNGYGEVPRRALIASCEPGTFPVLRKRRKP